MIQLINVSKTYDDLLFKDIYIEIPDNGLTFIYGKSGCGKSTFLNMIAGLDEHYQGKIVIDDQYYSSVLDRTNIRYDKISYMNQNDDLIWEMTIKENMLWFQSLSNYSYDINSFFEKFDLNEIENSYPYEISGGELSLMCLLKNIVLNRKYIILDEPTARLDRRRKEILKNFLIDLSKNHSVIVASHDLDFIENADCLFHFQHKKIIVERYNQKEKEQNVLNKKKSFKYKRICLNNLKFYKKKYIFSTFIFMLVICYCYSFFQIGSTVDAQIKSIINENGELTHIEAASSQITIDMIDKVKNEPFIDKVDYSFKFLYPSLNRNDIFMKKQGKELYFHTYPISYTYDVNDNLKENEIVVSKSLADSFQLKKGDKIDLFVYYNVSSTWDEEQESYLPHFKQLNYDAVIKNIVEEDNYTVWISHLKEDEIIQKYIGYDNPIIVTNQIQLYLKPDAHFLEVKDVLMNKYGLECTDLIDMAEEMLAFNSSTYDILKIFGFISCVAGVIYILTSLLSFDYYETRQRKSLELLGIKRSKILEIQCVQNIIPLIVSFVLSFGVLYGCIPLLNIYFYQQKLFYQPFLSLSSFINYDFSQVSILTFDFQFIYIIFVILLLIIVLYKLFLFVQCSKNISSKG